MKRAMLLITALLLMVTPALAQDCGNGLPCGPMPWGFFQLPRLNSPTPFPTVIVTAASGLVLTPAGTATPTPTGTLTETPEATEEATDSAEILEFSDQVGTLQSVINSTPQTIFDRSTGFDLAGNATNIFSFMLGLQSVHFGVFTPLVQLIFFGFFLVVAVKVGFWILPIVATFVGFIRKVAETIVSFIPGL